MNEKEEDPKLYYRRAFDDVLRQLNEKNRMVIEYEAEIDRLRKIESDYYHLKINYLEQINNLLKTLVEASMLKEN